MKIQRGEDFRLPDVKRYSEFELQQIYNFTKANPLPAPWATISILSQLCPWDHFELLDTRIYLPGKNEGEWQSQSVFEELIINNSIYLGNV